jgi:aspartate kinase
VIVCKFGGTSVQDADAIARTAEIVRSRLARHPVVVVSALGGVTDDLLNVARRASDGQLLEALALVERLRARHEATVEALLEGAAARDALLAEVGAEFDLLASLAEALRTLGYVTPRSLDTVAAMGELLSSRIVAAAFRVRGLPAEWVDARAVMVTDDHFTRAVPDGPRLAEAARARVRPVALAGGVPVLGGFVGATAAGVTTTLGRGGSDYSASLLGAALEAELIEIWTDVDGLLTADPRVVPSARLIDRVRFDEAAELAAFGAKVLHPSTIAPAVEGGIPVRVGNSRRPDGAGTMITDDAPRLPVRAIAGARGKTLVRIGSARMLLAHGFLARVFAVFDRHRTSVDVVTTSEVSVSLTLDDATHLEAIAAELSGVGDVSIEPARGVVAIVGAGVADAAATMAQCLAAIAPAAVHMVSLSATGINFTLVVDDAEVVPAMQRLHASCFPEAT